MPELSNHRQEQFATLIATRQVESAAEAYRIAYRKHDAPNQHTVRCTASQLARKAHVKQRIKEIRAGLEDEEVIQTALDKTWILTQGLKVYRECMKEGPVFNAKGEEVDRKPRDLSVASRMLALIGKETGSFETKKNQKFEPEVMSDAELIKKAKEYGLLTAPKDKKSTQVPDAKAQPIREEGGAGATRGGASALPAKTPDVPTLQ